MSMLPDDLRLGPVTLAVADRGRAEPFYRDVLGLGDDGAGLVTLVEEPGARPARRGPGLFHVALLYPSRVELARAALRLAWAGTKIQGASDHGTHEAIYLADPDGNGWELAADRPRGMWPDLRGPQGYAAGPQPLDLDSLMADVAEESPAARVGPGVRVGHVHLHVGDVAAALRFYRDVLGFDEMANIGSAAFVSAGGYHHHLAVNVWRGPGRAVPEDVVGLRDWTVELPSAGDVARVRSRLIDAGYRVADRDGGFSSADPWGIPLTVRA